MRQNAAAQLTALADGTLSVHKHPAVMRRVRRSASLSRALQQQRFAVEVVRSVTEPPPAGLRAWLDRACSDAAAVQGRHGAGQ